MPRREKDFSVILASLTAKEYARFFAAKVGYSGATGAGATPELYGDCAPYIATFFSELRPALRALRWRRFTVAVAGKQWTMRRDHTRRKAGKKG